MIEHLKSWCYVNNVDSKDILKIWEIIEKEKKEPIIFTKKWEILYYFYKLVKWKIKLEDFFLYNDIYFKNKLYTYKLLNWFDAISYLKNIDLDEQKIYIVDSLFKTDLKWENIYFI